MTALDAAALYAGLNLLILLGLAINVSRHRIRLKIATGGGGNALMERIVRVHGNAVEYIPPMLLALLMLALVGAPALLVHALGAAFTLGRVLHAVGYTQRAMVNVGRGLGMMLTWGSLLIAAGGCLYYALM
jgi:uncharacterized membrane protein YecN with MAPEG domain